MRITTCNCDLCLKEIPIIMMQSNYVYHLPVDIEDFATDEGISIIPSHDMNLCEDCARKINEFCRKLYKEESD